MMVFSRRVSRGYDDMELDAVKALKTFFRTLSYLHVPINEANKWGRYGAS